MPDYGIKAFNNVGLRFRLDVLTLWNDLRINLPVIRTFD